MFFKIAVCPSDSFLVNGVVCRPSAGHQFYWLLLLISFEIFFVVVIFFNIGTCDVGKKKNKKNAKWKAKKKQKQRFVKIN